MVLIVARGTPDRGLLERIYPVRLTATDDTAVEDDPDTPDGDESAAGTTASLDVGVWIDNTTLSPNDDGRCP